MPLNQHSTFRRHILCALALTPVWLNSLVSRSAANERNAMRFADIEGKAGGRLGIHVLDTQTGRTLGHRANERFGMCSTFKLLLAAAVLKEAEAGRLDLDTQVRITPADMVPHAPVTQAWLNKSLSIRALAEAAQLTSDNVATNLLLKRLGGAAGFTSLVRSFGDSATRLDRLEPEMNLVPPGEIRDTTTPQAMAEVVARVFSSDLLNATSRATLTDWTVATKTGLKRLRAGLPASWRAGDKTGTGIWKGMANKHNDIAIIWPPDRAASAPIVVAAYYEASGYFEDMRAADDAVLADAGRVVAHWVSARS
jgi:beta-lactamase class A